MPTRKIRVELFDSDGNRYTIAFEGQITREKAVRLLDLVELLGGVPTNENGDTTTVPQNINSTKYNKVQLITKKHYLLTWFTSKEIQYAYEQEYKEPISLSTISTYLSRLANNGMLMKTGSQNSLKYKLSQTLPRVQIKQ